VVSSRAVLSHHARSFRWAGAFLPREHLDQAAIVYAFCRLVDDTADEATDPAAARQELDRLRSELEGTLPARELVAATREVLRRSDAGLPAALHLIEGVRSDLDPVRLRSDAELHAYAYRVAGTVGLMMCPVLGVGDRAAAPFAVDLGVGMQITNICRDVREDAVRGRVYLPEDRLRAHNLAPDRLISAAQGGPDLTVGERAGLARVVRDLLADADRWYESGDTGLRYIPWRARLAIRVASRVYRGIGNRLRARGGDAWSGRAFVGPMGKVWLTVHAVGASILPSPPTGHARELHRFLHGMPGCQVSS
jgi:phytoene synthase